MCVCWGDGEMGVWPSHYLPFKVILVASAPGEVDLPVVARSIETAPVSPPPLKHNSGTKHTVIRQMLKKRSKKTCEAEVGKHSGKERRYHIPYPGGSTDGSHWPHIVGEKCLRNLLSQSANVCYKHHTD